MRKEGWKRLGVALSIFWVLLLSVGAYIEYEKVRTTTDVSALLVPDQAFYKVKSSYWLFDRYYKYLLNDEEVGLSKLPAPDVPTVLVFNAAKFFLLVLIPLFAFWGVSALTFWVIAGFRKQTSDT